MLSWGITFPSPLLNSVPFVASLVALVALVVLRNGANPPSAMAQVFERWRQARREARASPALALH